MLPYCHGKSQDKNLAGGGVAFATEGSMIAFFQSALEQTGLEVESLACRQWPHSAFRAVAMVRISPSWRYNVSTPSAEGGGNVSRNAFTAPTSWLALAKAGHWPPRDRWLEPLPWLELGLR
jgi:hypothetical protein